MIINFIEYLEKTVVAVPNKTAIVDKDRSITFKELELLSKKTTSLILQKTSKLKKPIIVFLPKSIENIVADVGIIYSGNIYSNLDIKLPEERIRNIINNIKPSLIISNVAYIKKLLRIGVKQENIININEAFDDNVDFDNKFIISRLSTLIDTDPLCIINTSGSTGTPKGVVLNHRSFIDFTEWAIDTLKISDDEIIGSLSPFYFDIYSFELCLLMAKSATINIIPEQYAIFPIKLIEYLYINKINFIFWVPTIMVNIANLNILSKFDLININKILFAGEVFPTKHLNYWRKYIPNAKFINLYGPIEITLDCTYYIVEKEFPDNIPIPIGYPCRNSDILILNDKNEITKKNQKGELCVRGTSLAMGYWNDPEKTSKVFLQNPLNKNYPELIYRTGDIVYKNEIGEIIFVGRKDFQVKHLGYRIDLSEIEHIIINSIDIIDNACVLYNSEKKEITLFYESKNIIATIEIRKELIKYLPKYMLPTVFIKIDKLPKNPNGKIDRLALKKKRNN